MIDVTELKRGRLTLHSPAIYRICVRGPLETSGSEHLRGLSISTENHAEKPAVTTLHGEFAGQAALLRVLSYLLGLNITLLSVEYRATEVGTTPNG
jgi:hypothetical protein